MIETLQFLITCLLGGTVGSVALHLSRRPAARQRPKLAGVLAILAGTIFCVAGLQLLAYRNSPLWILAIVVLATALVAGKVARFRDESRQLNEVIRFAASIQAPLSRVIDEFGRRCMSLVGPKARRMAWMIEDGQTPVTAARKARVRLDLDTLGMLDQVMGETENRIGESADEFATRPAVSGDCDFGRGTLSTGWFGIAPVAQRFAYLIVLLILAAFASSFIEAFVAEDLIEITGESYSQVIDPSSAELAARAERLSIAAVWLSAIVIVWLAMAALGWWTQWAWLLRLIPWIGPTIRGRHRRQIQRSLARDLAAGRPAFRTLSMASGSRGWIRHAARRAERAIRGGQPLAASLHRVGIVNLATRVELAAAVSPGEIARGLQRAADDDEFAQSVRWQTRIAWLTPVVIVGVGMLVLVQGYRVFFVLTAFGEGAA